MDVARDDLLAGAALALDQHRRVGRRDVLGELEHLEEALGLADRPGDRALVPPPDLLLELLVLHPDRAEFAGAPENRDQLVVGERLLDVVEGARIDCADGALQRGLSGHENDRCHRVLLARGRQDIEPGHLRHPDVGEDDVMGAGPDLLQPGLAALGGGHLEPLVPEQDPEGIEDPGLVVHHQHRGLIAHAASSAIVLIGRKIVKAVPVPGAESTRTRPRWASTARWTIASPSPLPPVRPETKGSKSRSRISSGMPGTGVAHLKTDRVIDVGPVRDVASLHRSYTDDDSDRPASGLHRIQHQVGDHAVQQVLVTLENRSPSLDRDRRVGPAIGVSLDRAARPRRPPRGDRAGRTGWHGPGQSPGTRSADGSTDRSPER